MKFTLALLVAALFSINAGAEQIVNIDSTKYGYNSRSGATVGETYSLIGYDDFDSNPDYSVLSVTLAAGDYTWSNAVGQSGAIYDGYSFRIGHPSAAWDFAAFDSATSKLVFTGAAAQQSTTVAAAQTIFSGLNGSFSLASETTLNFAVRDYLHLDNVGGVSLNIAAVPEPETYAMLLAGLGLVGFAARRRKS